MLVARGVRHLLVDTPSVDRYEDQGRLAGHRLFWGMEQAGRKAPDSERRHATITEMIYVDAMHWKTVCTCSTCRCRPS